MARINLRRLPARTRPLIASRSTRTSRAIPLGAHLREAFAPVLTCLNAQVPTRSSSFTRPRHVVFFDHYSGAFATGIGSATTYSERRWLPAHLPPSAAVHAPLATQSAFAVADELLHVLLPCKALDHGCFSPLSMLWHARADVALPIVPLGMCGSQRLGAASRAAATKLGQACSAPSNATPLRRSRTIYLSHCVDWRPVASRLHAAGNGRVSQCGVDAAISGAD